MAGCWVGVCAAVAAAGGASPAWAQTTPAGQQASTVRPAGQQTSVESPRRLRVYLDCDSCFSEYLRNEIGWVDFVRQPQDADVHLLGSSRGTGGGGQEYALRFVGAGRFQGTDTHLRAVTMTGDPEEVRRAAVLQTVVVGLLRYLAHDGLPAQVDVTVRARAASEADDVPARDRWNLWVFSVRGGGSFEAEESSRETRWTARATADRVTDRWKISFGASIDERSERFNLDEDDPFEVTRGNREVEGFVARSLGPHWSLGLAGRVDASDFGNTRFSSSLSPAIEFSVFPYRDYATRQLVFQYEVGVDHVRYNEITLFDKVRETLWRHEASASFDQRQRWGSIEAGLEWSQYLHDVTKYRLEADTEVSVRILRGLSVNVEGSVSRIRDQISLPRRNATPQEVLLRLRELQSGYEVRFSFSLTYTFGSLFNNVVNPRFGR